MKSYINICISLCMLTLVFSTQGTFGDEETAVVNSGNIPKTGKPLVVESKKKPHQQWVPKETYSIEQLVGYTKRADPEYSRYGGIKSTQFPATGFFYTTKYNDRWWLVDPEGHLCIHKAICSVTPGGSDNYKKALQEKYGTEQAWAESTATVLKKYGFNGTGSWSADSMFAGTKDRPVYARKWSFMSSYGKQRGVARMGTGNHTYQGNVICVFDPDFEAFVDDYAKQLAETKDDPYLLGHFSDNELPFRLEALENFLKLNKGDPGYQAAITWLQKRKGKQDVSAGDITPEDREAFLGFYMDRYYSIVSKAIKKYDPNHLYLGSRLIRVSGIEPAIRAYANHVDVMSVNWYGDWMFPRERFESWAAWVDKPFILSEWYAKGHDVPGLTNESGAGWLVKTQKERGYYYQNMALNLMASKSCVGWHWFRYSDNDPADLTTDPSNRNSNKGIVNIKYEPYAELVDAMKAVNTQAYRIIEFFDDASYEECTQSNLHR